MGNFEKVIEKAKIACEASNNINDHFPGVRKTIKMPKGAEKQLMIISCLATLVI